MSRVYLSLGSNLGDRLAHGQAAIQLLDKSPESQLVACSAFFESEPLDKPDQPVFLNAALAIDTTLSPHGFLDLLQAIETHLGRIRRERFGPRPIDLDILFWDNLILQDDRLEIPHPRLVERRFVLAPLAEIAPELRHPQLGQTISELLVRLGDHGGWVLKHTAPHNLSARKS